MKRILPFLMTALAATDLSGQQNVPMLAAVFNFWDKPSGIAVRGDYAYVASRGGVLYVVDISDLAAPELIRSVTLGDYNWRLSSEDSILWAWSYSGFAAFSLAQPELPEAVWGWRLGPDSWLTGVAVDGGMAVFASEYFWWEGNTPTWDDYFAVYDVTDIRRPRRLGGVDSQIGVGLSFLDGDILYGAFGGLHAVTLEDPARPQYLFRIRMQVYPVGMMEQGELLIGLDQTERGHCYLATVSLEDVQQPRLIGTYDEFDTVRSVVVVDTLVHLLFGDRSYACLSQIEPDSLQVVSQAVINRPGEILAVEGATAAIADTAGIVAFLDLTNLRQPTIASEFENRGSISGVVAGRGYAYVAAGRQGLRILDIDDPSRPQEVGHLDLPSGALRVAAFEDIVFVATVDSGIYVCSVRDPGSPQVLARQMTTGIVGRMQAESQYLFYVELNDGLRILSTSDLGRLHLAQTLAGVKDFSICGDRLVTAGWTQLDVYDIRDRGNPSLLGRIQPPNYRGGNYRVISVECSNQIINLTYTSYWVVNHQSGSHAYFARIDFSDLAHPVTVANIILAERESAEFISYVIMAEREDKVFIGQSSGAWVYSFSAPDQFTLDWTFSGARQGLDISFVGSVAYLASDNSLRVYDCSDFLNAPPLSEPSLPQSYTLTTYPNPFNSATLVRFNITQPGAAKLTVHDYSGRAVAMLAQGGWEAGTHQVVWNAANQPSGVYIVRLEASEGLRAQKVVLVR